MTPIEESKLSSFDLRLAQWDEACAAGETPPEGASTAPSRWQAAQRVLEQLDDMFGRSRAPFPQNGAIGGEVRFGRFVLRREIGRGGFGVVFLADDPQLGRQVALKIPRPELLLNEDGRQRFLHEGRAAATLDHPNIVMVHDAGEIGPVAYIAMAYCPGPTLAEWLKQHPGPMPPRDAATLVAALADAMQHAHSRGVLHRDLKPGNILLQKDEGGRMKDELDPQSTSFILHPSSFLPKIADFGLARRLDDPSQTQTGAVLGTPKYMAPEQAAGRIREVGTHSDLYSLGAILYELLTGRPPFEGTCAELTVRVQQDEPVPPRKVRNTIPRDLETICLKCLAKEPSARYLSAAELREDLRNWMSGNAISARTAGFCERFVRLVRRKPALSALAVVICIAIGLAAWGAWRYTVDLRVERDAADHHRTDADRQRQTALNNLRTVIDEIMRLEVTRPELDDVRQQLLAKVQIQLAPLLDDPAHLALADETGVWLETRVGDIYRNEGNYDAAGKHFVRARTIADRVTNRPGEARTGRRLQMLALMRIGDIHRLKNELTEARRCYDAMFSLNQVDPYELMTADERDIRAASFLKLGDMTIVELQSGARSDLAAEALRNHSICHEMYRELVADFPDRVDFARMFAHTWDRLSDSYLAANDWRRAVQCARSAIEVRELSRKRLPECSAIFDFETGHSLDRVHTILMKVGDCEGAAAAAEETREVRELLLQRNPQSYMRIHYAALVDRLIGNAERGRGRVVEATTASKRACEKLRPHVARLPNHWKLKFDLATALDCWVDGSYLAFGQDDITVPPSNELLALLRQLVTTDEARAAVSELLVRVLWEFGDYHLCRGRISEARALYDEALETRERSLTTGVKLSEDVIKQVDHRQSLRGHASDPGFDPFVALCEKVRVPEFLIWIQEEFRRRGDARLLAWASEQHARWSEHFAWAYASARGFAQAANLAAHGDREIYDRKCVEILSRLLPLGDHMVRRIREDSAFARYGHLWTEPK